MALEIVILIAGLAILYYGAEFLVRGSANTAVILGANPIIVGLTVVAFGTSAPELVTCLIAVYRDSGDLAIGNIVGSNIANIGLVMAIGALIYPIIIQKRTFTRDIPIMLGFTAVFLLLGLTGQISRAGGGVLFAGVVLFTGYLAWSALKHKIDEEAVEEEMDDLIEEDKNLRYELLSTAGGIVGVVAGAYLLVESATSIARDLGVSDLVIGVTVVAVGTSLPELATTIVAAIRKHADLAVGNIIGSNIYNIGLIMGITGMAKPVSVSWETATEEMVVMALFSIALLPFAARLLMGRFAGLFFLVAYGTFIYWSAIYKTSL